jgi:hypothetical protein
MGIPLLSDVGAEPCLLVPVAGGRRCHRFRMMNPGTTPVHLGHASYDNDATLSQREATTGDELVGCDAG